MKEREGDQSLPVVNEQPDIQSLVIEDIRQRREVGVERYGTALQAGNGRDALQDLYEELLDGAMYVKQVMVERAASPEDIALIRFGDGSLFERRGVDFYKRITP